MPEDLTGPGEINQCNFLFFAGLKARSGTGGDVEAHAVSRGTVKCQGAVYLEEVVVATYLNRAITGVLYKQSNSLTAGVSDNIAGFE